MTLKIFRSVLFFIWVSTLSLSAQVQDGKPPKLTFFGDLRIRGEQDWNSRQFDGAYREDRHRMRARLRLGFNYQWSEHIRFGGRIRTGVANNIQSPHFNLGYRGLSSKPFQLDRYFLQGTYSNSWWWMGKNSFPFWNQNELWWDDDVQPEGISFGLKKKGKSIEWRPTVGYFIANHNQDSSVLDATLFAAQLAVIFRNDTFELTAASGLFWFDNIFNVPEADDLFTGKRYRMDYHLLNSGIQLKLLRTTPLVLGLDYLINLKDYSENPNLETHYKNQKTGYVFQLNYGKLNTKKDWLFGYYYAYKEALSVVSYYAEDDWVRWGNINRNRNTNYAGHEFRIAYCWGKNFNMVLRFYTVKGLVTPQIATETGNRIRLDFNIKF